MLSLTLITPNQGETYYTAENYYSPSENQQHSQWFGQGARRLGLTGQVQGDAFKQLLHGYSPKGNQTLSGRKLDPATHRAGIDLTFSAPKSVSLAALVAGNEAIEQAHRIAVHRTLEQIEQRYAQTRVRTPGGRQAIGTGNLIVAQFHHDTSREKDPQLHTHCVALNATQLEDGRWQSLHNDPLFRNKMLLGVLYRNELAAELQRLGYEIEVSPGGLFELKGYTADQLHAFSKRSDQIQQAAGAHASSKEKEIAALYSRAPKGKQIPRDDLRAYWHQQAQELNLQHPQPGTPQWHSQPAAAVLAGIEHCSEREAVFQPEQLERFALENHLGQQSFDDLQQTIQHHADLIRTSDRRLTTQAAVLRELETIRTVLDSRGQLNPIAKMKQIDAALQKKGLTAGQQQAIVLAATTPDRFIGWQGVAGAGKSYALNLLRQLAESQGYRVRGLAPSAEAAKTLAESAGIRQTTTVAAKLCSTVQTETPETEPELWIVDEAGLLSARDAQALVEQAKSKQARVVFVGDTQQLSAVEAGNPFKSLQQAGMATAYLTQSLRQKNQQIKSGVDLIAAGRIAEGIDQLKPFIHPVQSPEARSRAIARDYLTLAPEERQRTLLLAGTNQERLAITQLIRTGLKAKGQLGQSIILEQLKARDLTEVQARYAHHIQSDDVLIPHVNYKRLGLKKGQHYPIVATDRGQNTITLRRPEGSVVVLDPGRVKKKSIYTRQQLEVAVGDRLRWTRNDRQRGRRNGQEFEVMAIEDEQLQIRYCNGKTECISNLPLHPLDYALVSTTYSAQGKSAARVIGALDRHLGRESFYVAVSRVKHELKLYCSEALDRLVERAEKSRAKENPSDALLLGAGETGAVRVPGLGTVERARAEQVAAIAWTLLELAQTNRLRRAGESQFVLERQGDRLMVTAQDGRGKVLEASRGADGRWEPIAARLSEADRWHFEQIQQQMGKESTRLTAPGLQQ